MSLDVPVRRRRRLRTVLTIAAVLATCCAPSAGAALTLPTLLPSATTAPRVTWRSGAFSGYGPSNLPAFGTWRGTPVTSATDFAPMTDWAAMENLTWDISAWSGQSQYLLVLSVGMWPQTGGSLAEAASGAYNEHFAAMARTLVAAGMGSTVIRLGWEFNGSWYRWAVKTPQDAADYAEAWRQIVGAMRSVPGQNFGFDWSVARSAPGALDPALSYPGDDWVTDIGMSVYDWSTTSNESAADRWNDILNGPYGLAWQASFAAEHHKPLAYPEWALAYSVGGAAYSGGDDTQFIQNMSDWFATHDMAYENYFNHDTNYGTYYGLTTGGSTWFFLNAKTLYRRLW